MNVKEFMETPKNSNEIEKEVYESHMLLFFGITYLLLWRF